MEHTDYKGAPPLARTQERQEALRRYHILDTAPEKNFDQITRLVAQVCGVPTALITLIDEERQWFKSCFGYSTRETDIEVSFCVHAVHERQTLVVENAAEDPRFAENPLVTEEPGWRFYAGAPLKTPEGVHIGTLCIIDYEPRVFDAGQRAVLEDLADLVVGQFELRSAEAHYRKLFQGHPQPTFIYDIDTLQLLDANGAATRAYGYPERELRALTLPDLVAPVSLAEHTDRSTEGSAPFTARHRHRDGTALNVEVREESILFQGRQARVATMIDVAERERSRQYQRLVENVQEVVFETDLDGRATFLNSAWERATGFSVEEALGDSLLHYVHPKDRVESLQAFAPLLQRRQDLFRHRTRFLTRGGGTLPMQFRARLITGENGTPVGTVGTLTPLDEIPSRAPDVPAESETPAESEALFPEETSPEESLPEDEPREPLADESLAGEPLASEAEVPKRETLAEEEERDATDELDEELFAGLVPELAETPHEDTEPAPEDFTEAPADEARVPEAPAAEESAPGEPLAPTEPGAEAETTGEEVLEEKDVLEEKQETDPLAELGFPPEEETAAEETTAADEPAIEELFPDEAESDEAPPAEAEPLPEPELHGDEPEQTGLADVISEGFPELETLEGDFDSGETLAAVRARLSTDPPQLRPASLDFTEHLRTTLDDLEPAARRKGLMMHRALPERSVSIDTDAGALRLLLAALVNHAISSTDEGSITVSGRAEDRDVRLRVVDTGADISKHLLNSLLNVDVAEPDADEQEEQHLQFVHRLVNLLQGSVEMESQRGRGTVFTVKLPRRPAFDASAAPAETASAETASASEESGGDGEDWSGWNASEWEALDALEEEETAAAPSASSAPEPAAGRTAETETAETGEENERAWERDSIFSTSPEPSEEEADDPDAFRSDPDSPFSF